uniref:NHL repeat-containing protein 2 n=1 Tax=Anthurium amnicola TaxID=1678845 RepID=A0A1D1Y5T1_9ARAE
MKRSAFLFFLLTSAFFGLQVGASPTGALVRHLSSLLKWTARAYPRTPQQADGNVLQFENGYIVETVVEGNKLGVTPHTIRVSPEGELLAVDSINNNIVRITPPLSQYSRARLVAGSGYSGHVDGKPSDARFNLPRGVTMDDKGNVYVADTANLAIRKIGESGVTTIAGGKSNTAGYRDGPSEDAKFSSDFDVVYVGSTCSLLVVDRGNAALRQISLQQEDYIMMVIGAVLVGYTSCLLQHGSGSLFFTKKKQTSAIEFQNHLSKDTPSFVVESLKEDTGAAWPSFGRLLSDLLKFGVEALGSAFLYFIPLNRVPWKSRKGLTPLKDRLMIPEDKSERPLVQNQTTHPSVTETLHAPDDSHTYTTPKTQRSSKPSMLKDSLVPSKYRKRQEFSEYYGSSETSQISSKNQDPFLSNKHRKRQEFTEFFVPSEASQVSSKVQKERIRHRHRDKSSEGFGVGAETKPTEIKSGDYADAKFDSANIRSKFRSDDGFHLLH